MGTATSVAFSASLIQDYLQIETSPTTGNLLNAFVALQEVPSSGQPATVLFAASNDNQSVLSFWRDPTSSSGWGTSPAIAYSFGEVSQLCAFTCQGLNVFVPVPAESNTIWFWYPLSGTNWIQVDGPSNLLMTWVLSQSTKNPGVYTDPAGNVYLYGAYFSETFYCAKFVSDTGPSGGDMPAYYANWQVAMTGVGGDLLSPSYLMLTNTGSDSGTSPYIVVWTSGATISYQSFSLDFESGYGSYRFGSVPAQSITLGPDLSPAGLIGIGNAPSGFLALADASSGAAQQLYYVSGYDQTDPSILALSGQSGQPQAVSDVQLGIDSSGNCNVFALDGNLQLWVLRQSGLDGNGNPQFGTWALLGDTLAGMACPATMLLGPELFAVDQNANLLHINQNADGTWFTEQLATPVSSTGVPQETSTYTWDIDTTDDQGNPVASSPVSITADRAAVIFVNNGLSYYVDPNTPAELSSDATGKLTIAVPATTLTAPLLTVTIAGQSFACPGDTQSLTRLAGNDPSSPVTPAALQQQGLMAAGGDSSTNDTIVGLIRSASQAMLATRSGVGGSGSSAAPRASAAAAVVGIDFGVPGDPRRRVLSREEALALMARVAGPREDIGSWLSDVFGDVKHSFSQAIDDLKSVAVSIGDEITVALQDIEGTVAQFTLSTVDQIGDLVELILQKIQEGVTDAIQAIAKVIEWLELLLDWDNILNTQQVVVYVINQTFTHVASSAGSVLTSFVTQELQSLEGSIDATLQAAAALFTGSFNEFASSAGGRPNTSSHALSGSYQNAYQAHKARCNYVSSKTYASAPVVFSASSGLSLSGVLAQIEGQAETLASQLGSLNSLLTASPASFFESAMSDVISAVGDVIQTVLALLNDIADDFITLAHDAVLQLQDVLNATIDIPVISWLWQNVITQGEPLTLLNLLGLIIAVPATILYEVVYGGSALRPPFTAQDVQNLPPLPWPALPGSSTAVGAPAAGAAAAVSPETQQLFGVVGGLCEVIYTLADVSGNLATAGGTAAEGNPIGALCAIVCIACDFATQGLGPPWSALAKSESERKSADNLAIAQWAIAFAPPVADVVSVVATQGTRLRFLLPVGPIGSTVFGAASLAVGIAATVEQAGDPSAGYGPWTQATNIVGPLTDTFPWVLNLPDETGLPIYTVLAFVIDAAATVCLIGSAVASAPSAGRLGASGGAGNALSLSGGYVLVPYRPSLAPSQALGISALVYLPSSAMGSAASANMKIVSSPGFTLGLGEGDYGGDNTYRTLYPEFTDASGTDYTFQMGQIPFDQWVSVQAVWNQGGQVQGFIAGQVVGWVQTANNLALDTGENAVVIGADESPSAFPFQGLLSSVTLTDLSTGEVLGSWPLNDGIGTSIADVSGNDNDGSLSGSGWSWITLTPPPILAADGG